MTIILFCEFAPQHNNMSWDYYTTLAAKTWCMFYICNPPLHCVSRQITNPVSDLVLGHSTTNCIWKLILFASKWNILSRALLLKYIYDLCLHVMGI